MLKAGALEMNRPIALAFLVLLLVGQSFVHTQSMPDGRLVIYSTFPGHRHVVCDDTDEGSLSRNRYLEIALPAGRHVCYIKRPAHHEQTWPRYTFDIASGQTLWAREYSEMWVGDGLTPVSQETWDAERPKLKPEKK